jgi:hypothetical protein
MPSVDVGYLTDRNVIRSFPADEQKLAVELYNDFSTLALQPLWILMGGILATFPALGLLALTADYYSNLWLLKFIIILPSSFIAGIKISRALVGLFSKGIVTRIYLKANENLFSQQVLQRLYENVDLVQLCVDTNGMRTFRPCGRLGYPREISFK